MGMYKIEYNHRISAVGMESHASNPNPGCISVLERKTD